jgi:hypothetical protein
MSIRPSAHPRLTWRVFGALSGLALLASLMTTIPSGDRTTIVLSLWGVLLAIGIAAALTYAIITPMPDSLSSGPRGGFVDAGGSGGAGFGDGGCGAGDGGDGGS